MFETARDGSWLYTMDTILGIMVKRISTFRKNLKDKTGVVENLLGKLKKKWDDCAGYEVLDVGKEGVKFNVIRTTSSKTVTRYTLNIVDKTCICGQWQDNGYPCIDAMAFFRLHANMTFDEVVKVHVDRLYTYEAMIDLFEETIEPVCMDSLTPDGVTLPPRPSTKRATGRPKKKRIRKRSKFSYDPELSIKCSNCHEKGHNVRTCPAIHGNGGGNDDDEPSSFLDNLNELDLS
jgi:hypothetical protein